MRAPHRHQSRSIVTYPHAVERLVFEPNHEPVPREPEKPFDGSQPELRVGPDADKLQRIGPALAVHEHKVGPQMAVAAVRIPALHRMVDVTGGKRRVRDKQFESGKQCVIQVAAVRAPLHAFEVAPKLRRALDRPHAPIGEDREMFSRSGLGRSRHEGNRKILLAAQWHRPTMSGIGAYITRAFHLHAMSLESTVCARGFA